MKTHPAPSPATPAPDPKLVKKVRRTAASCFSPPLPSERDHDYLPLMGTSADASRPKEFGRPMW